MARCMVYPPDGDTALTIGDSRSADPRVAGNFLALVPGQPQTSVRTIEDGFAVFLGPADWLPVMTAIGDGQPVTLDAGASGGLSLTWIGAAG